MQDTKVKKGLKCSHLPPFFHSLWRIISFSSHPILKLKSKETTSKGNIFTPHQVKQRKSFTNSFEHLVGEGSNFPVESRVPQHHLLKPIKAAAVLQPPPRLLRSSVVFLVAVIRADGRAVGRGGGAVAGGGGAVGGAFGASRRVRRRRGRVLGRSWGVSGRGGRVFGAGRGVRGGGRGVGGGGGAVFWSCWGVGRGGGGVLR